MTGTPELSVVIPARDAAATLGAQLEALLGQEWKRPWELLVVDSQSRDGTRELVEGVAARDDRVRFVAADRLGESYARNVGIDAAQADAIAMCDADDVVADGWLPAIGDALLHDAFVTGPLELTLLNPPWVLSTRGRAIEEGPGDFLGVPFAHGCNMGFHRDLARRVGGFDESLPAGPDIDFSVRLAQAGTALTYVPAARVHYRYRTDLEGLWRQARVYGQVRPRLARRFQAAGITLERSSSWRGWLWLARHVGAIRELEGRARWVWIAGGQVGRLEGALDAPWAGRVSPR